MTDGASVRVKGLNKTMRDFKKLGASTEDLRNVTKPIADMVADDARTDTPVGDSGRLKGSVRAGATRSRARVLAGSARVPYAGVQEYGWPDHNVEPQEFLQKARERNLDRAVKMLRENISRLAKKYGFQATGS